MKKYLIGGALVVAFGAYYLFANGSNNGGQTALSTPPSGPSSSSTGTSQGSSASPAGTAAGQYKNGTYTGSVADAFYGNLQATVTISGGKITDVQFPQHPTGGHSSEVSAQALPILRQEAIAAQSANVDVVSGATQDSQAFQQSLASALAKARA